MLSWALAIAITGCIVPAAVGFTLAVYWLLWSGVATGLVIAIAGAGVHAWRASTRFKRPLKEPIDQAGRDHRFSPR
jgi:hypothetical protein